ncbi:MAG: tetratricopeptide repeat protein [Verrucomicrobiota bacterium]
MKKTLPILLASLAAALAAASGAFMDRAETLQRIATGMAAGHGFLDAGMFDSLRALAWERGGWNTADLVSGLATAAPVFLFLSLSVILSARLPGRFQRPVRWIWVAGAVSVFCWGLWNGWKTRADTIREPRLLAPVDLLEKTQQLDGRIFFNPSALFVAPLFAPSKIEPGLTLEQSARLQASLADWRAEDRKNPFTGIVFAGGDVRSTPFLEMVRLMPGWSLAAADNHGLLFVRQPAATEFASPELAKQKFDSLDDQAVYLSQAAMVQQAIGRPEQARQLIRKALELSESNPVLVHAAQLAASEGRWPDVLETARRVLKKNPRSIQARYLEALALFESGAISKAAEKSNRLAGSRSDDSAILGLQARVAARNNDPATEIAALEKLLALAKRRGHPVGDFHALLGQAWARRGFPDQALSNYQAALDANPSAEARQQIEESMKVIRERTR